MELFDEKYVNWYWKDDSLIGKKVIFGDNLGNLKIKVNGLGKRDDYENATGVLFCFGDENFPVEENDTFTNYRFAYYDPNLEYKIAYKRGDVVQYQVNGKIWKTITEEDENILNNEFVTFCIENKKQPFSSTEELINHWNSLLKTEQWNMSKSLIWI